MKTKNESRKNGQEKGFTLVELMIALAIGAILITAIYQFYKTTQNTYLAQDQFADLQQNARIGIEAMVREMRLAGYQANCPPSLADNTTGSNPQSVLFEFDADTDLNGTTERIKYSYDSVNRLILRSAHSPAPTICDTPYAFAANEIQQIASNVESLTYSFYDTNNGLLAVPVASPEDIRRITINLAVSDTKAEGGSDDRTVTVTSDVKLRNQGLKVGGNCVAPTPPAGFSSTDPGVCGRAKLTWTANASSESVNNYRIYWRPAGTSEWTNTQDVGNITTATPTGLSNNSSYEFAVAAQNTCAIGTASNPSTVTLNDNIAPVVPTGANATASTSGALQVNFSWNATTTKDGSGTSYSYGHPNYDVASYKVYRAPHSGAYAEKATVAVPATTYTDTTGLNKCTVHDYKVTAVDQCGNESAIASSSAVYGDANLSGGITDAPTNGTTRTRPSSTTAPADPTAFTAIAGGLYSPAYRIDLSWLNPPDPPNSDFTGTRIRYRSKATVCLGADYPTNATTSGTLLSPDQPAQPGSSDSRQDNIYANNTYYCFKAFSYDACGNYSTGAISTAQAKTCGDSPVGPPPGIDTNSLKLKTQCDDIGENRGVANLIWSYAFSQATIPDLVGFNVYRTNSINAFNKSLNVGGELYYLINESPVFFPSAFIPEYSDNNPGDPLNPGTTYKYVVTVLDCTGNESAPSQILTAQPGKIDRDTAVNITLSGTFSKRYNIVKFALKNTSASPMTFRSGTDQAVLTWTDTAARLTRFTLDGTTLWQDPTNIPPSHPTTCGASSCSATITLTGGYTFASLTSAKDVSLTFRKTDGSSSVDMRGETITIQPYYRNDTAYASNSAIPACFNNPAISLTTETGSAVSGTKQNPPVDGNNAPVAAKKSGDVGVPPGHSVDATSSVTITSVVTPPSTSTISSVIIYYFADSAFSTDAPDPTSVTYSSVAMTSLGANIWRGVIPASPGNRIWFFVEAVDSKGNYSTDPNQATSPVFLAFTYDQLKNITVTFTASFVDPGNGDKHVTVAGTAADQAGPVVGGTVNYTIGGDSLSGSTDGSGNFTVTSTTDFSSGDVPVSVTVTKSGSSPGTCSNTLPAAFGSITCP